MLTERLKTVLPSLISKNQTANDKGKFISEGGRLISGTLEISDNLKIKRLLMTLDTGKAFDSVNHLFLITSLDKHGIEDFIKWIQILIQNKETCIINGGQQQIILSLKNLLEKVIQFQHICLYLFWKSHYYLS